MGYIKKLIIALGCVFVFHAASGQQIIKLDIDTTLMGKVIVPNLENLQKLLNASQKDYVATVKALGYVRSTVDTDYYNPKTSDDDPAFGVTKVDQTVGVVFYRGDYPKHMKDLFLGQYTNLTHTRVKGADSYEFKDDDGKGGVRNFSMIFDLPRKGGGSIILVTVDQ